MGNALDFELSASLLRFWSDSSPTFGKAPTSASSSLTRRCDLCSTMAAVDSDGAIRWAYAIPAACPRGDLCLEAARYGTSHPIPNASHMGSESWEQMDAQCANRCGACGVVQGSIDELSEDGFCSRCFIAKAGAA
jgi:hypothetical protein